MGDAATTPAKTGAKADLAVAAAPFASGVPRAQLFAEGATGQQEERARWHSHHPHDEK